ncbi:hypothetical protein SSP35_02_02070 [Streptomyces sp. NBRC 110611]|nr:hypothetical protein SSP35_02_02070 [Streptomyces sp. NBRC 110611]
MVWRGAGGGRPAATARQVGFPVLAQQAVQGGEFAVLAALEVPVPNGTMLPPAHAPAAREWLCAPAPGTLLVPVHTAIDRLEHGRARLSAEHAAHASVAVAPPAASPVRRTDR